MSEIPSGDDHTGQERPAESDSHLSSADDPSSPFHAPDPSADADTDSEETIEDLTSPHMVTTPVEITNDSETQPDKADPTWKIIGAVSMATMVTAGVIVVFLLATGRGGFPEPQPPTPPASPPETVETAKPEVSSRPQTSRTTSQTPETSSSETTPPSTTETPTPTPTSTSVQVTPTIPSTAKVTEWAKVTTGLSPNEPFSAAPSDTWMNAVTGVSMSGTVMVIDMNADASIDTPAGTAAAEYYSAVLSGASRQSWESLVTEVTVLDSAGTPMASVPVQR